MNGPSIFFPLTSFNINVNFNFFFPIISIKNHSKLFMNCNLLLFYVLEKLSRTHDYKIQKKMYMEVKVEECKKRMKRKGINGKRS